MSDVANDSSHIYCYISHLCVSGGLAESVPMVLSGLEVFTGCSPRGPGPAWANHHSSSLSALAQCDSLCSAMCAKYEKAKLIAKCWCCDRGTERLAQYCVCLGLFGFEGEEMKELQGSRGSAG